MRRIDLYELVKEAQQGDQTAMLSIIYNFYSSIGHAKRKTKLLEQDDLEQTIIEHIISATLSFNLDKLPDFSEFLDEI